MRRERPKIEYHGWYRYKNVSGGDLLLSRPLKTNQVMIPREATFEGDSYYQTHYGVKLIANLSHKLEPKKVPVKESKNLLVEEPIEKLEIIKETQISKPFKPKKAKSE